MNLFWEAVKLIVVLGFILAAAIYVIKFGLVKLQPDFTRRKGSLQVLERLPLSQRNGLYLVRAGEKYYLLGVSVENITMLTEVSGEELVSTQGEDEKKSFREYLESYAATGEDGEGLPPWKRFGRMFKREGNSAGGSSDEEN